jgi:succinate dehydrogenase/fumarate reductase-like Fe-S protein
MKIHVRRTTLDAGGTTQTFLLPDPRAAGLGIDRWEEASVSIALQYIQRHVDPGLAYALSCRRGLCNICAVKIDDEIVTACTTPVADGMTIEPSRDKLLLRDTVVELSLVRKARILGETYRELQDDDAKADAVL